MPKEVFIDSAEKLKVKVDMKTAQDFSVSLGLNFFSLANYMYVKFNDEEEKKFNVANKSFKFKLHDTAQNCRVFIRDHRGNEQTVLNFQAPAIDAQVKDIDLVAPKDDPDPNITPLSVYSCKKIVHTNILPAIVNPGASEGFQLKTDLHTHLAACNTESQLVNIATANRTKPFYINRELLRELGIQTSKYLQEPGSFATVMPLDKVAEYKAKLNQTGIVNPDEENDCKKAKAKNPDYKAPEYFNINVLNEEDMQKLYNGLTIPPSKIVTFDDMEEYYRYREPFMKNVELFEENLRAIAQNYRDMGVTDVSLSFSKRIVHPDWLSIAEKVCAEEAAKEPPLNMRFLVGMSRLLSPEAMHDTMLEFKSNNFHPIIEGVDVFASEINSTYSFFKDFVNLGNWAMRNNQNGDINDFNEWNPTDILYTTHELETMQKQLLDINQKELENDKNNTKLRLEVLKIEALVNDLREIKANPNDISEDKFKSILNYLDALTKGTTLRIHAGETPYHPENVLGAVRLAQQTGCLVRVGHGIFASADDPEVIEAFNDPLVRERVIIEKNPISNVALNHVDETSKHTLLQLADLRIPIVLGSDGNALYCSDAKQIAKLMDHLDCTLEQAAKVKDTVNKTEQHYTNVSHMNSLAKQARLNLVLAPRINELAWQQHRKEKGIEDSIEAKKEFLKNIKLDDALRYKQAFYPVALKDFAQQHRKFIYQQDPPKFSPELEAKRKADKQKHLAHLKKDLEAKQINTDKVKLQEAIGGKQLILLSGGLIPEKGATYKDYLKATGFLQAMLQNLDPIKVAFVLPGTNYGLQKAFATSIAHYNSMSEKIGFPEDRFSCVTWLPENTKGETHYTAHEPNNIDFEQDIPVQHADIDFETWYQLPKKITQELTIQEDITSSSAVQGLGDLMILTFGGGMLTRNIIQTAFNLISKGELNPVNNNLFCMTEAPGASQDKAKSLPNQFSASYEEMLERLATLGLCLPKCDEKTMKKDMEDHQKRKIYIMGEEYLEKTWLRRQGALDAIDDNDRLKYFRDICAANDIHDFDNITDTRIKELFNPYLIVSASLANLLQKNMDKLERHFSFLNINKDHIIRALNPKARDKPLAKDFDIPVEPDFLKKRIAKAGKENSGNLEDLGTTADSDITKQAAKETTEADKKQQRAKTNKGT